MDYKKYNDYELVYHVRESDDDSKDVLFQKYEPILHKLAHEFYLKFSEYGYDYDDFYQEALISFYRSLSSYNEEKHSLFYSFVVLCVKRGLMSFCRNISTGCKNIS